MAIAAYPGDNDRGERAAARYLEFYPSDHELHMRLGYFRLWEGKYQEALDAFQEALRLSPDHAPSREGVVEAQAGIALLARLENPPPARTDDPAAYPMLDERRFRFINDLLTYRRYFAAYEQLMLLAERHDHTRRWLSLYARIDRALVDATGATPAYPVDRYRYLLALQPDNHPLRYMLVDALIDAGRLQEAYEILLDHEHVDVQDAGYVQRLHALDSLKTTGLDDRIRALEDTLEQTPGDDTLRSRLIALYHLAQRPEDALCKYEEWLALEPENAGVQYENVRLLLDLGRYNEALPLIERLLTTDADHAPYLHLLARAGG